MQSRIGGSGSNGKGGHLFESHAFVDNGIEQVGEEIAEQDKGGNHEIKRYEGGIVALQHGLANS